MHRHPPQEEAEAKTAALQEAWRGYQAARQEVQDTYAEFQRQRDELVDSIRQRGGGGVCSMCACIHVCTDPHEGAVR